jgi:hypothetical protein
LVDTEADQQAALAGTAADTGAVDAPGRVMRGGAHWAVALVAMAIVLAIGGPLFGRGIFMGADIVKTFPPWSGSTPSTFVYQHGPVDDTIDFYAPERELIRDAIVHEHRVPLWNEYPNGGTPLGSLPNDGLLSPLEWPMLLFGISLGAAWTALLRLVLAAVCTAALCRRLGLSRFASNCAAIVYSMSGFIIVWSNWPQSNIAAWIPALFLAADVTAEKRRLRDIGLLGVVVAAMLLEGYPPLVVVSMYTLLPFLVIRVWQRSDPLDNTRPSLWQRVATRLRAAVPLAEGVVLGVGFSAFQMIPFALRLTDLNLAYRESSTHKSLPAASLLTTVFPWAVGSPAHPSISASAPNFVGSFSFLGAAAMVFVIVAIAARTAPTVSSAIQRYLAVTTVVIALPLFAGLYGKALTIGGMVKSVVYALPVMTQVPIERLVGPFLFLLSLLAAIGIERVLTSSEVPATPARSWQPRTRAEWLKLALVAAFCLYFIDAIIRSEQRLLSATGQARWILEHSIAPLIILLTTIGLVVVIRRGAGTLRTIAVGAIPVVLVVEALLVTTVAYARVPKSDYFPDNSTITFLQNNLGPDRFAAADNMLFPSAGTHYDLRAVNGHSFSPQSWRDLVAVTSPGTVSLPTLTILGHTLSTATSPALDAMAAKYFVVSPDVTPYGKLVAPADATGTRVVHAGGHASGTVQGGPLRAVSLQIPGRTKFRGTLVYLDVTVRDASGKAVATGVRRLQNQSHTTTWYLPVTGELLPKSGGPWTVDVGLRSNSNDTLTLPTTDASHLALGTVRDENDGLVLAHVDDGALVWQRLNALPRIRWASSSDVLTSAYHATIGMAIRKTDPNHVMLNKQAPAASGAPATISVLQDSSGHIRVSVDAKGFGYLVVADAIQSGWKATIDGVSVPILPADRGLAAIPMNGGKQVLDLRAAPQGWHLGIAVSLLSVLGALTVMLATFVLRRRRSTAPDRANAA